MLSGRLPYEAAANEWVQAMMRVVEPPTPLRKLDAHVPVALDDAVRRAMAREPRDRPSADELGRLLAAFQHDEGVSASRPHLIA
jgi:hypothetical protein